MNLANLDIKKGAFLAPMADYTNIAFRKLCSDYGSIMNCTELISAKALTYKSKKTREMLDTFSGEKCFLQLFGYEPKIFSKAISLVEKDFDNFAGYDLNCGCSVPKALKSGYGCSLMDYPKLVGEIISEMKSSDKAVTVKMRLGLEEENFLVVAKKAQDAGADAITLHARLGNQMYSGSANWKKIKELKKTLKIPVIGNGDVISVNKYEEMKRETNCDFVMVGRGAIGNAFLFKQIKQFEEGEKVSKRTNKEVLKEGTKFLEYVKEFNLGINDARGYFIGLAKNFSGAKELRNKFATSKTISELETHFTNYFNSN